MSDRFEQLAMRRRQLLLRSARLRADLAADHLIILDAIGGIDRAVGKVRGLLSVASPILLAGGGAALLLRLFRGSRRARAESRAASRAVAKPGLVARSIAWVALARRLISLFSVVRAVARSRSRHHAASPL
ncbi:MAG TPA: hypothetical protein VFS52_17540 [Steroidobacteraceae bacterium]|jgi:hypothetical protein|nr:hypothetical protein [Steroidobacteraceae bacterium]